MDAYFDTAIILKLYVQEANSPDAIRLAGQYPAPFVLTPWQEIEVRTAPPFLMIRGVRYYSRSR